jgi:hypothetical protein
MSLQGYRWSGWRTRNARLKRHLRFRQRRASTAHARIATEAQAGRVWKCAEKSRAN